MRPSKIILITVDTLRADRLGCYGYGKATSPNIDGLAGDGVLYPNAFSPCPYTVPTHTSLLTGLYPVNHSAGLRLRKGRVDPDGTIFLQEILKSEGYRTGAFVSALVLGKGWGLDWGFDVYDDAMTGTEVNRTDQLIRDGRDTNKAALGWIRENRDRDLFVWIHYFDVHGPYTTPRGPSEPFLPEDYGDTPILLNRVADGQPGGIPEYQLLDVRKDDNGVRYQDDVVGELMDGLKEDGLYDDAMILLTADHGEALGEGGVYFFHGLTVTPEQTRVPLIVKPPSDAPRTEASDSPVSSMDIMPTVFEYAGFRYGGLSMDGVSLTVQDPERFVLSENEWQRALIWREFYLLREKDVVFDGFVYYFDSRDLCRGTRLLEYRTGKKADPDPSGPAGELVRYSDLLRRVADPKEWWIKDKDGRMAELDNRISELVRENRGKDMVIENRENVIGQKDELIGQKEKAIGQMKDALDSRKAVIESLERELGSVYNSKSWKLTYPLRWASSHLKGDRD